MADSEDWLAIYDERVDNVINVDDYDNEADFERALRNYFDNPSKPRIYRTRDGIGKVDYNHGKRLLPHIKMIADRIWKARGKKFLGIRPVSSYSGSLISKTFNYKFKYTLKTNQFKFYQGNKLLKKIPVEFFTKRYV